MLNQHNGGAAVSSIRLSLGAYLPGVMLSVVLAMAANFVSDAYGGPAMLFALLLGIAFNFVSIEHRYAPGLRFASKEVLPIGIALLGAPITAGPNTTPGFSHLPGITTSAAPSILFCFFFAPA